MSTPMISSKTFPVSTFQVKGEDFVVLKNSIFKNLSFYSGVLLKERKDWQQEEHEALGNF